MICLFAWLFVVFQLIVCELVEPPDGERESEPDGDRVDHDGEVGVEQHEETPRGRKLRIDLDWIEFSLNLFEETPRGGIRLDSTLIWLEQHNHHPHEGML